MSLLESKCSELDCWHFTQRGYIYCGCCLHGRCSSFSKEQRAEWVRLNNQRIEEQIC